MTRRGWFWTAPAVVLLGVGGGRVLYPTITRGADGRIIDAQFLALEDRLDHHLYAPTWLPHRGRIGSMGAMQGARRVLQDFADNQDRLLCILSQEQRSRDRDAYHKRLFVKPADARGDVNGAQGYFITGDSGERRLFWNRDETALILSSSVMTDAELLKVAREVR
jgi:hypothetical protein